MSKKLFLTLVRQYAREALRRRRSYKAQVEVLWQKYQDWIATTDATDAEKDAQDVWALHILNREYGSADPAWFEDATA